MKFNSLNELNDYINKYPEGILDVNINSLEVSYTSKFRMASVEESGKYPCYVMFGNEKEYLKFRNEYDVEYSLSSVYTSFTRLSLSEFNSLRELYDIEYIEMVDELATEEPEIIYKGTSYSDVTNWGANLSGIQYWWDKGNYGQGIKIGVVDTRFEENQEVSYAELNKTNLHPDNDSSHGTSVSSVIVAKLNNYGVGGIAPDSDIYAYATGGAGGGLLGFAIDRGLDWCMQKEVDIINMSFSSLSLSTTRRRLLDEAYSRGIYLVAASSNTGGSEGIIKYPAAYEKVIAVGAVKHLGNGILAPPWFDVVNGNWVEFVYAGENVPVVRNGGEFTKYGDGTSFATPAICGLIALYMNEYPDYSRNQIIDLMKTDGIETPGINGVFPVFPGYKRWHPKFFVNISDNIILGSKIQVNINGNIETITKVQTNLNGSIKNIL